MINFVIFNRWIRSRRARPSKLHSLDAVSSGNNNNNNNLFSNSASKYAKLRFVLFKTNGYSLSRASILVGEICTHSFSREIVSNQNRRRYYSIKNRVNSQKEKVYHNLWYVNVYFIGLVFNFLYARFLFVLLFSPIHILHVCVYRIRILSRQPRSRRDLEIVLYKLTLYLFSLNQALEPRFKK